MWGMDRTDLQQLSKEQLIELVLRLQRPEKNSRTSSKPPSTDKAVATTTPFGPRIHALAIYLKGFQALSYERLRGLFRDAFGLSVSEGALMNMFIRSHPRFEKEAEKAKAIVRAAQVVASDETGVRIEGTNSYHWVFHCKDAVVHQPDYSRAARVVDEMMAGHKPAVWISDRYSAQQKHGERHQTCLAHLARDTAFALELGSDDLPFRFKLWLGRAFDLARAVAKFAASTLARKKRELEKQLTTLLEARTECDLARELQAKIGRARDQLLTFCGYPGEVDVANNTSERKLRPCVIQRKVTNGYRAMWAAEAEADVRTTVDTARLEGANPFAVIVGIMA
jgi:transposase